MVFEPPTKRQIKYAIAISIAIGDEIDFRGMDKWQIRDYISKALKSKENCDKVYKYTGECMRHNYEQTHNASWLSNGSLGGEWGLDASDFGAQAWGNS